MTKILERSKNIPEAEERLRTFILDAVQNRGNMYFSANAHQCNIAYSVVRVYYIYGVFLSPWYQLIDKAYSCFRLVCANGKQHMYTQ